MAEVITYAGVRIDNCSVREALQKTQAFLNNEKLNMIETISMKTLVAAGGDAALRDCLERVSLVLPGDKELLESSDAIPAERIREVEDRLFFHGFMKLAVESQKTCYILAGTEAEKREFERFLRYLSENRIRICGSCALSDYTGEEEDLINEMNGVLPDVILSILPSPRQEYFLFRHMNEISSGVWYGIGAENDVTESRTGLKQWIHKQKSYYRLRRMKTEK